MLLAQLEIIARVERGGAFDPRMDRVGGDDVEFLAAGQDKMAGVVEEDSDARVVDHVVILLLEERGDDSGDQGFDFADGDVGDFGISQERAGGDAGAASDHQNGARAGCQQGGQVAEHALQAHVLRVGGGFDFAADVEIEGAAAVHLGDSDGGVHALAHIDQSAVVAVGGEIAAVSDELPRNGRDRRYTKTGQAERHRQGDAGDDGSGAGGWAGSCAGAAAAGKRRQAESGRRRRKGR